MKKYLKITLVGYSSYYVPSENPDWQSIFCEMQIGEKYQIELVEMTEEEYAAMPEFEGF